MCVLQRTEAIVRLNPLGTLAAATLTPAATLSAQDPSGGHAVEVWVSASPLALVDENGIVWGSKAGDA